MNRSTMRWFGTLVLLVTACRMGPAVPTPTPSPTVSATQLTGPWLFGQTQEPPAGPIAGCYPSEVWQLEQRGEQVNATVDRCIGPCGPSPESAQGTNRNGRLQLEGIYREPGVDRPSERVVYDLTYDPRTRHLVGTRDGQPFWAAPFVQQPKDTCGPAPL